MITFLKKHNFIGNKEFYKVYISLAVPVILHQMITTFAQLIDGIMVGGLGDDAVAAVGACNQLFFIIFVMLFGLAATVQVFISQYLGAKDEKSTKTIFNFGIFLTLGFSLAGYIVLSVFRERLLGLYITDQYVMDLAVEYYNIILISFFFFGLSSLFSFSFRAYSMPKIPLIAGVSAVVSNTLLNAVLIYGLFGAPALGVKGAAIATLIARIIELLIFIIALHIVKSPLKINPLSVKNLTKPMVKKFSKTAVPLMFNEIMWATLQSVLSMITVARSDHYMTALTIAATFNNLFIVFFSGISNSTSVVMGQTLGAGNFKKAKDSVNTFYFTAEIAAIGFAIFANICIFFVPLFYGNVSPEIVDTSMTLLRVYTIFFMVHCILASSFFILRSGGDIRSVLIIDVVYTAVIVIPVAIILRFVLHLDFLPTVIITMIVDSTKLFISVPFVKKGRWLRNLAKN